MSKRKWVQRTQSDLRRQILTICEKEHLHIILPTHIKLDAQSVIDVKTKARAYKEMNGL